MKKKIITNSYSGNGNDADYKKKLWFDANYSTDLNKRIEARKALAFLKKMPKGAK